MNSEFRDRFDLPRSVCYLDAAAITPRTRAVGAGGVQIVERTVQPWLNRRVDKAPWVQRLREATAGLIGATASDMAITSSVSYGIATAAANLVVAPGSRVLTIAGDHPSAALVWHQMARDAGASVDCVPCPVDGDWTRALIECIEVADAPPISVAALAPLHWSDGALIDLARLAPLLRARGAALVVDATQAAGVLPLDVRDLQPDFLAFPTYKWLLGPFGCALLYVHPKHQHGRPLEHHMGNRVFANQTRANIESDFGFLPGAQRFDRGERDDLLMLSNAVHGAELLQSVPAAARLAHVRRLTQRMVEGLAGLPLDLPAVAVRAPHIVGLNLHVGDAASVATALEASSVFVSPRLGKLRVAPWLYSDERDIDGFVTALRGVLKE